MKWLRRIAALLLLLVLVLAASAFIYTRQASPVVDGPMSIAGPKAEIRIERDANGIPTIKAMVGLKTGNPAWKRTRAPLMPLSDADYAALAESYAKLH